MTKSLSVYNYIIQIPTNPSGLIIVAMFINIATELNWTTSLCWLLNNISRWIGLFEMCLSGCAFICVCTLTPFLLGRAFFFFSLQQVFPPSCSEVLYNVLHCHMIVFRNTCNSLDFQILFPPSLCFRSLSVPLSIPPTVYPPSLHPAPLFPESFPRRGRRPRHVVTSRNSEKNSNWRRTSR